MNMKIRSQYGYKIDKEVPKNAVRYNGYAVAVTFDAQKELDQYKPFGVYENLFRTVSTHKVGQTGYEVDAFDGLTIAGKGYSYLRDNKNMKILVMTLEEARMYDRVAAQHGF